MFERLSCIRDWYVADAALANEYQFTRFLIVRSLGLCYVVVFWGFVEQGLGLIGENGILPIARYLDLVTQHYGSFFAVFQKKPSLFWFAHSNAFLFGCGWLGLVISLVVFCGYANGVMFFVLWVLQLSIVHVGQIFWSYGWETQLLETSFLAMFLVPLFDGRPFPKLRSSRIVVGLYCWLIARIMLGAGLIKMRGDAAWSWTELSALFYHFETQPIPNGFSWYFHNLPHTLLQAGVVFNHVVELFVPILLLLPRPFRNAAGCVMILFQLNLIVSGNLSYLNYLTIVPCLACIDDRFYGRILPKRWWVRIREPRVASPHKMRTVMHYGLLLLVGFLSIAPVTNLLSPNQRMNASFEPLHLVNTYGAFGSVGKVRYEIEVEGTDHPDPLGPEAVWRVYSFYGKPGDVTRRPPFFAPYHHRLDWEIWFASFGSLKGELWPAYFAVRLLQNEPSVLALLRNNPFPDAPPYAIRMVHYTYRFTTLAEYAQTGHWWVREFNRYLLGPVSLDNPEFQRQLRRYRWEFLVP